MARVTKEAKPCPFCGSEVTGVKWLFDGYRGTCFSCGAMTKGHKYTQDAIDAWNTRATADELADTTKDETAKGPDMAKTHTTKDDNAITKQARYCEAMTNRLAARVALHESTRAGNGWCYDVPKEATHENIDRMIVQLRLELLLLRELLDDAAPGNTTAASVPF